MKKEGAGLDTMAPNVKLSFHRPGSKDALAQDGKKEINAESAKMFYIPKGKNDLELTTVVKALKEFGHCLKS